MASPRSNDLEQAVVRIVRAIPPGSVLSYGRIALLAGRPGGASALARLLRSTREALPWWRVVRADRTLAREVADRQAARLQAEGVEVRGRRIVSLPGDAGR